MKTPADLNITKSSRKPITKFPQHILENPCFEESGVRVRKANTETAADSKQQLEQQDYIEKQKRDYLLALKYIEENLLSKPINKWESKDLVNHFERLGNIACKTLVTHECSKFKNVPGDKPVQLTGFRQIEVYTPCDLTDDMRADHPDLANYIFNLLYPNDIFNIIANTKHLQFKTAFNFIKWFIKWHPVTKEELKEIFRGIKETILRFNQDLLTDPDPLLRCSSIDEIFFIFGAQDFPNQIQSHTPGKPFDIVTAQLTGKWPKFPDNTLQLWLEEQLQNNSKLKSQPIDQVDSNWLWNRATDLSLYTKEEILARDLVLRFFPSFKTIPNDMKKMAESFTRKIEQGKDPIHCACYLHFAISHILHPYLNGNHRIGRMLMNAVLMSFGYAPLEFNEKLRKQYYAAMQNGFQTFEKFIRDRIHYLEVQDLCGYAKLGKLKNLNRLLSYGISVNATSSEEGWTPLHFACRTHQLDCAASLIQHKADVAKVTRGGNKALDFLTDAEKESIRKLT